MRSLPLQNILVTAYSPLGTPDSPEAGFKENVQAKKPMDDPLINKVAKDLGKSPAQVGFLLIYPLLHLLLHSTCNGKCPCM